MTPYWINDLVQSAKDVGISVILLEVAGTASLAPSAPQPGADYRLTVVASPQTESPWTAINLLGLTRSQPGFVPLILSPLEFATLEDEIADPRDLNWLIHKLDIHKRALLAAKALGI